MIDQPIPSQCVTSTVLNKPKGLMSVATKVAVQMNAKLGGEPWAVKIPMKDTMIIGYVSCWSMVMQPLFRVSLSFIFRTLTMIRCTKGSQSEQSWPA